MNPRIKDYIRYLLLRIKVLYAENEALKALNDCCWVPEVRSGWRKAFEEVMADSAVQEATDAKFDPHIAAILLSLDHVEEFEKLLRTPTRGLPD